MTTPSADDRADANPPRASATRVIVRATELADAAAIAQIRNQPLVQHGTLAMPHASADAVAAWLVRLAARRNGGLDLCAEVDGRVVGHGGLELFSGRRAHCALLGIGVHDAYAGRGVGRALMAALVDGADRALGLRRIELTVFADNARAIALYRRFGFVEEGARAATRSAAANWPTCCTWRGSPMRRRSRRADEAARMPSFFIDRPVFAWTVAPAIAAARARAGRAWRCRTDGARRRGPGRNGVAPARPRRRRHADVRARVSGRAAD